MKNEYSNSALDFIFKVPKKLLFSRLYRFYFDYILRLLYRVILFEGIPETVNETFFKLILYTQGKICFLDGNIIDEGKKLLALNCARADTPDVYYIPRKVLVVNPRLKKSYNITPGEQCEIIYLSEADKYNLTDINGGLYELISRTSTMLADNDISINIAQKNTRLVNLVSGDTQNTVDSIKAVIASMYEGDPTIVVKSSLIDKLQGVPIIQNNNSSNILELIEANQYILAHFLEQIGICVHDQIKRERVITGELNDNLSFAFLSIDDILESIQEGLQRVNAMFGTKITARLNPIIEQQRAEQNAGAQEAAPDDNVPGEAQNEDPEEEASPDLIEEPEPEPAAEPEPEEASEETEPEEEPAPEEPEPEPEEPEPEPEEEPEEEPEPQDQTVDINIEGDNNTIIITGGDDLGDMETGAAELPDVEPDNDGA